MEMEKLYMIFDTADNFYGCTYTLDDACKAAKNEGLKGGCITEMIKNNNDNSIFGQQTGNKYNIVGDKI